MTPEPPGPGTAAPQAKAPVASLQPPSKATSDNRVKSKKGNVEESAPTEVSGFSQGDIHDLLQMAQTDAGAGRLQEAKIKFEKVLALQPNNQDAKEGLRKVKLSLANQQ